MRQLLALRVEEAVQNVVVALARLDVVLDHLVVGLGRLLLGRERRQLGLLLARQHLLRRGARRRLGRARVEPLVALALQLLDLVDAATALVALRLLRAAQLLLVLLALALDIGKVLVGVLLLGQLHAL